MESDREEHVDRSPRGLTTGEAGEAGSEGGSEGAREGGKEQPASEAAADPFLV